MARPRKDAKTEEPPKETPEPAKSNAPDRDTVLFMVGQFRAAKLKMETARNENKRLRQRAKNIGFEVEQLDRAIAEMDRKDNATLDQMTSFAYYAKCLDLPIGYQMQLFGSPGDERSVENEMQKAERAGYERGLQGLSLDEQAYPPLTQEGEANRRGWDAGQKVLQEKFVKHSEEMAAEEAAKAAKKKGKEVNETPQEEADEALDEMAA